jgi:phosphatidylglycerol lysyltransferase
MIARNNSQGPHASRWRVEFGPLNFRRVGSAGAVSGRNAVPPWPANRVNENSSDNSRSIVLGHGDIDEPIPRIDPAHWRATRTPTAFDSASPGLVEETLGSSRLFEVFRQYGNFTMAYATLQPGMKYFQSDGGYLAYDTWGGITFVLGDPVAPARNHAAIIEAFVRSHPRTCFCQISKATGAILARLGWLVNELGADMELDLATYDFEGPKKSKFRQAAHKIEREGYTIEERMVADGDRADLDALSSSWLAAKTVKREARFLVRPLAFGDEPDVRKFYLRDRDGSIVSFVTFDPICEGGEVIGYSPAIKRRAPDAPTGAEEAITKFAIEQFRAEGFATFRLGLLPLYDVQDSEFRDAWFLKKAFQFAYRYGDRWIFSFRGHADFKHRYRGNLSKVYFATYTRLNAWNLIALLRLCRLH